MNGSLIFGRTAPSVSLRGRRRLIERLPGGLSIHPALVPCLPLRLQPSYGSFDPLPSVIFVEKSQYHNNVHCHDAVSRDYSYAWPASLPMANMVSGHVSPVTTNTSYQTARPIRAAVWMEKMAKNSLRHLSGTLHIDTRRSGSGVDITSRLG